MASYERLQHDPVLDTVRRLEQRIGTRFPGSGLAGVAGELVRLATDVKDGAADLRGRQRRARTWSRVAAGAVLAVVLAVFGLALHSVLGDGGPRSAVDWLPLIETVVNDVVFASIALFFLYRLPERLQRDDVLALLHRLRSLAHIVDMHQLTKDPERLRPGYVPTDPTAAPGLDRDQLERYLDYCSELLSLVGKAAALCAEESTDAVVLASVSDVEDLTTSLSRKIWQKIALLPRV